MCFRFSTCKTKLVISKLCRIALAQDFKQNYVYTCSHKWCLPVHVEFLKVAQACSS